ncbi:hypothetical protein B0G77_6898 [Paraburkholderia sp. BL10I2N1]|nr:hypothetical protein B0G77_6898 [Paraburkholderia sp. BL10I2N1]
MMTYVETSDDVISRTERVLFLVIIQQATK